MRRLSVWSIVTAIVKADACSNTNYPMLTATISASMILGGMTSISTLFVSSRNNLNITPSHTSHAEDASADSCSGQNLYLQ